MFKSVIDNSIQINTSRVKNRIIMPALLCFNWADEDGFETISRSEHYGKRAKGGTGLIIIEASAISMEGRITNTELGIWKDAHIQQFKKIANTCHKEGSLAIVQIVHAGMNATGYSVYSSSKVNISNKECKEMSIDKIMEIKRSFVSSAIRAKNAGLDGIEIHGAHGYLLNQFTSKEINRRSDQYGGSLDNRLRLPLEIINEIRHATGNQFILSYRIGVNDSSLLEDKYFAKKLEQNGINLLNVSGGIGSENIIAPEDFPFSKITYMGTQLHKEVTIPVACVFGIREPFQAEYLLKNDLIDMVAVGRGLLADPHWTNKAIHGDQVNICYNCLPKCKFTSDGRLCPSHVK